MDSTQGTDPPQDSSSRLLVGGGLDLRRGMKTCPHAQTIEAYSEDHGCKVLIALTCKRWGCQVCGRRRCINLALRVATAHPDRLITLTVDPKRYLGPREAYDSTRRKLSDLSKLLRIKLGSFEYLRVLEVTKKGWPHYHLVARCPFIKQPDLSQMWAELTGAPIVDIRRIEDDGIVYGYVMKYLAKQTHVPWTNRRVSWSREFFPASEKQQRPVWNLASKVRLDKHPADVAERDYQGYELDRLTPTCWAIVGTGYRAGYVTPNTRWSTINGYHCSVRESEPDKVRDSPSPEVF